MSDTTQEPGRGATGRLRSLSSAKPGEGTAAGSHTYTATGLYTVTLVLDDDGGRTSLTHEHVVVYDPDGGFATGGGWFESPAGAVTPDITTDVDVAGPARFASVSKYAKGATVPAATTAFRFAAANNTSTPPTKYDWMVILGSEGDLPRRRNVERGAQLPIRPLPETRR